MKTETPAQDRFDMHVNIVILRHDGDQRLPFASTLQTYNNMGHAGVVAIQANIADTLLDMGVAKCIAQGDGDKLAMMGQADRVSRLE